MRSRSTLLKRCPVPTVRLQDLFIGAQVTIYSRQLKVIDYADNFTRKALENKKSK